MEHLDFLSSFNEEVCYQAVGPVEQVAMVDSQINYNSANQMICATSG